MAALGLNLATPLKSAWGKPGHLYVAAFYILGAAWLCLPLCPNFGERFFWSPSLGTGVHFERRKASWISKSSGKLSAMVRISAEPTEKIKYFRDA